MNLEFISSIKKKKNIYYLWHVNEKNYKLYLMFQKKRGNIYKKVSEIVDRKKALCLSENILIQPFYLKPKR